MREMRTVCTAAAARTQLRRPNWSCCGSLRLRLEHQTGIRAYEPGVTLELVIGANLKELGYGG